MTLVTSTGLRLPRALLPYDPRAGVDAAIDVLVVGSGIAGMTVAASLSSHCTVAIATKGPLGDGSTRHAQGGVAASLGADDTPDLHFTDTMAAGAGLCDDGAVRVLVDDASDAIFFLERSGLALDLAGTARSLTREGGHSRNRIVHAGGDATGSAIARALESTVRSRPVTILEDTFLADLIVDEEGVIAGALVLTADGVRAIRAGAVVLATGGYGQLFAETTAPTACTGDGAAAALRAGAVLTDLEFVQFHPTSLHVGSDPRPLLSEAMRGEGARLWDLDGVAVTEGVHPLGDLAPRDVVSRAVVARMRARGDDHVLLDATRFGDQLERRFPTIAAACRRFGIDPSVSPIPVSPAAHYSMGGVRTDLDGKTSLDGLFAVGEVAASGVHGANRLASNSLLEGVVFGRRVAHVVEGRRAVSRPLVPLAATPGAGRGPHARAWLRRTMVDRAGVVRTREGLESLVVDLAAHRREHAADTLEAFETENLFELAHTLSLLALRREESRGAHFRTDFPNEEPRWHRRQLVAVGAGGELEVRRGPVGESEADEADPSDNVALAI